MGLARVWASTSPSRARLNPRAPSLELSCRSITNTLVPNETATAAARRGIIAIPISRRAIAVQCATPNPAFPPIQLFRRPLRSHRPLRNHRPLQSHQPLQNHPRPWALALSEPPSVFSRKTQTLLTLSPDRDATAGDGTRPQPSPSCRLASAESSMLASVATISLVQLMLALGPHKRMRLVV